MAETIYIDRCSAGSSISVIFTQETEVIDTGLSISSERNRALALYFFHSLIVPVRLIPKVIRISVENIAMPSL